MGVMVALLRGVNVGGTSKLPMADLRRIAEACGYDDVQTYIQSGNVLLRSSASASKVATELRRAIEQETGLSPDVLVRTAAQMAKVVTSNPFLGRGADDRQLHVTFMDGSAAPALRDVDLARYAPEDAAAIGKELYLYLPDGIGRSKLAADLSRRPAGRGTARNWRTVVTLSEMAAGRV